MNTRQQKKKIRRKNIKENIDLTQADILEIGAFDNPTFSKDEASIYYCDYFSKDELNENHAESKPQRIEGAVDTDFIVKGNSFQQDINRKFDLIIANHVIEHIPNVIEWLQSLSLVLKEGGFIFLTIPHKEYTFDKLRQATSLSELIRNYDDKLRVPSLYQIFDQIYYHRPIKASLVWQGNYEKPLTKKRYGTAKEALDNVRERLKKSDYIDVHCNVFTYSSFSNIAKELYKAGYVPLELKSAKDVVKPYNEFYALLSLAA